MNTVLSLMIMLRQNTLNNDTTHIISNYIINHIGDMENMGIKTLAEACYTSTTSIMKFCRLIGFDSYSEFRRHLLSTVETRKLQLIDKHRNLTLDELLTRIEKLSIDGIDKGQLLHKINQIIDLIIIENRLHFYGAVFPLALTQSFCEDMAVMGVSTYVHQILYRENNIENQRGVHIIITMSGRYIETNRSEYRKLVSTNKPVILVSRECEYIGDVLMNIALPRTKSSDYDDIILLLLLDIIKLLFYNTKNNVS